MKLHEKIFYLRKKAGKTQEELAEQLGVSRQAVSKWETGESEPEIGKLKQLALVFGVTVDFLLSEQAPPEADEKTQTEAGKQMPTYPKWMDSVPGFIGKTIRRYGWIVGVYAAVIGALLLLIGGAATFISNSMMSSYQSSMDSMFQQFESFGGLYGDPFGAAMPQVDTFNPVAGIGTVIMVIGAVLVIGGVLLALWLKKKGADK